MATRTYLLLGSNLGDREAWLSTAVRGISTSIGAIKRSSAIYETAAWGIEAQPPFLNQVVEVETNLLPEELLAQIGTIENAAGGRARSQRWGARTLDLDILFYGEETVREPGLIIPHPAMAERRFTLAPLAELAPALVHPVLKKSVAQLLSECPDTLAVKKLPVAARQAV